MRILIAALSFALILGSARAESEVDPSLKIVVIRHAEKPLTGENLNCQGENRARHIPAMLEKKFGRIERIYVPSLASRDGKTLHSRMFQTATPTAIRFGLEINSQFTSAEPDKVAQSLRLQKGTILVIWNHSAIPRLMNSLGFTIQAWKDADFDSILVIDFRSGSANMTMEAQEIFPSQECIGLGADK